MIGGSLNIRLLSIWKNDFRTILKSNLYLGDMIEDHFVPWSFTLGRIAFLNHNTKRPEPEPANDS